jgi:AcrR family transcriptional regulator/DNA-binding MarR family transcriptional regulator
MALLLSDGEGRVPVRRRGGAPGLGAPGPRGGGVYLSRVQQTRLLDAAVEVVAEGGLKRLSAARVSARAGMSTKTFYDLFADREDCFLAVFDRAVAELATAVGPVWSGRGDWVRRVRGAVVALLGCLERDPALARIVFVEALAAGPRVLARRVEVLDRVAGLVDEGRVGAPAGLPGDPGRSALVAEGVVGAAFGIVHARLLEEHPESLLELAGPVVATVVLPYRGREVSARELARPVPALPAAPKPLRGGVLFPRAEIDERRRVRLLRAAVAMVDEHGYAGVTVAHIAARAKISRRAFYELFEGREQCLLAVMADIDAQLTSELQAAGLGELGWRERMRIGLWTVLRFFDREPVLARFCVVESARGEGRMAAYRAELLARVAGAIAAGAGEHAQGDGAAEHAAGESPLVAEGVAGAVVSILGTRLSSDAGLREASHPPGRGSSYTRTQGAWRAKHASDRGRQDAPPLAALHGELMALIVLPYLGPEAAQEERVRPAPAEPVPVPLPVPAAGSKRGGKYLALDPAPASGLRMRMTYRTALVLEAIALAPGISNLGVAERAEVKDQGQISKLLARLERNGLVQNTGRGQGHGAPNEWRLTPTGRQLQRGIRERVGSHGRQAA